MGKTQSTHLHLYVNKNDAAVFEVMIIRRFIIQRKIKTNVARVYYFPYIHNTHSQYILCSCRMYENKTGSPMY